MRWADIQLNPPRRTLRQFAAAWLVVLGFLALQQGLWRGHPKSGLALAVAAIVVGTLGLIWPRAIRWLFVGCTVLAFPIGWLVSQLILVVLFFGVLTPVALLFRLMRRDLLQRRPPSGQTTFWAVKTTPQDLRRYLRQF